MVKNMVTSSKPQGVGYVYLRRLYKSNHWAEGIPCPTNNGVSYTNLVWIGRDLKKIRNIDILIYMVKLQNGETST
jgi:hypothetical protein